MRFFLALFLLALAAASYFLVPGVSHNQEQNYADDAIAVVKMVATTNKMYALDYHGQWTSGPLDNACNSAQCTAAARGGEAPACNLVSCNYLSHQDWETKKYNFYSLNPTAKPSTTNACGTFQAAYPWVACAIRKTAADGDRSAPKYSAGWGYAVSEDGALVGSVQAGGAAAVPLPELK